MLRGWIICIAVLLFLMTATGCSRQAERKAQGYMEGRYTYIAAPVSGVLKQWFVKRGDRIKQGDKLFVLEEQPESDVYQSALHDLKQVMAARDAVEANLEYARLTLKRYQVLVPRNAIDQSQLDNARANYQALQAQLAEAKAAIASTKAKLVEAKWTKDQKIQTSPVNAVVFDTYYRTGEYTLANQAILSLLAPDNIKAIFYVPGPVLGTLKLGRKVSVQCDGCSQPYDGRISFISPSAEYTPPVIYSNETNEKLVYRIEAEFAPEEAMQLHPGQPVMVRY